MKISLLPLFSKQNPDPDHCLLGCQGQCKVKELGFQQESSSPCPLSLHQAETCSEVLYGKADVIFNKSATGDGKSLAAYLPGLIDPNFRIMGLYPTNALVEDQERQHKKNYEYFNIRKRTSFSVEDWLEKMYGTVLAQKVKQTSKSNKFQEILFLLEHIPILLSNPDIFHLITHYQYLDITCDPYTLVGALAQYVKLWVFDEFHVFSAHQEAAVLNSMLLIRSTQQRQRRFLFTTATPKQEFISTLKQAKFTVKEIGGDEYYVSKKQEGFRPILQQVDLQFEDLQDLDTLEWLTQSVRLIAEILTTIKKREKSPHDNTEIEVIGRGRGLIILNSVALAGRSVQRLKPLLAAQGILVEELSGRIGSYERERILKRLRTEEKSILIVGTSAVDVGVDFDIHLLIFEASDSSTFIQRLGRLGRHEGFSAYQAFALISKRTPWIWAGLEKAINDLPDRKHIDRHDFREIIKDVFNAPSEFWQYRQRWGAIQAQGMLHRMSIGSDGKPNKERQGVMQPVRDKMRQSLQQVYGNALDAMEWYWKPSKDLVRKEVQEQLLRFRGGSTLQAAVWDGVNFYSYDLLRLLPNADVAVIERQEFLTEAQKFGYVEEEFPKRHIHIYLKIQNWLDQWQEIELRCHQTNERQSCTLSLISGLVIISKHPQATTINKHLRTKEVLAFLVPITSKPNDHWRIYEMLRLNPTFGLYRLTDVDGDMYACAFNQDALLLDALAQRGKLKAHCQAQTKSFFF